MKKTLLLLISLTLLSSVLLTASAEEQPFVLRHGDENSPKIAITMDDCYEPEMIRQTLALCKKYGVTMTFFPLGYLLDGEGKDLWQEILDAGCELGSHTWAHNHIGKQPASTILSGLGKTQQKLDEVLGYHYEIRWVRPPFGNIEDEKGNSTKARNVIEKFGYEHIVLWNVSQTDPAIAVTEVKNGCIMLYHARNKDVRCLETLIPKVLEMGYQPVTLSELFGFDPPATGGELYTFNRKDYE